MTQTLDDIKADAREKYRQLVSRHHAGEPIDSEELVRTLALVGATIDDFGKAVAAVGTRRDGVATVLNNLAGGGGYRNPNRIRDDHKLLEQFLVVSNKVAELHRQGYDRLPYFGARDQIIPTRHGEMETREDYVPPPDNLLSPILERLGPHSGRFRAAVAECKRLAFHISNANAEIEATEDLGTGLQVLETAIAALRERVAQLDELKANRAELEEQFAKAVDAAKAAGDLLIVNGTTLPGTEAQPPGVRRNAAVVDRVPERIRSAPVLGGLG